MARRSTRHWPPDAAARAEYGRPSHVGVYEDEQGWWALGQTAASAMPRGRAVALNGLGHRQAFWRTDLALPPIKRFLAMLSAAA